VGVAVSLVVAGVLSAWASTHPDGLEHVAQSLGFADTATSSVTSGSPLAGYASPGVGSGWLSSGVAGVVGVVVVAIVMVGLLAWLRRPSSAEQER
jgi:cobalt/nickel transport system permease protein/cobalt/nickel transport protein